MNGTIESLQNDGFTGFRRITDLGDDLPTDGGVYVVVRRSTDEPVFLGTSTAGRYREKDPTVSQTDLRNAWVPGVQLLYVGASGDIRRRLYELARFGAGHPAAHWGGRFLWQLHDAEDLEVAWKATPEHATEKATILDEFRAEHGAAPFANRTVGEAGLA
ncbi:hypothetical protein [Agromyces humi]|uniref:hypothetical protein n=1 Tax=Agromyces humi TaxID=1766800 RepID=UPI00135CB9BB|nr:hypothetical protein [Agromyces humi]